MRRLVKEVQPLQFSDVLSSSTALINKKFIGISKGSGEKLFLSQVERGKHLLITIDDYSVNRFSDEDRHLKLGELFTKYLNLGWDILVFESPSELLTWLNE